MLPKVTTTLAVAFPAISAAAATINKRIINGEDAKEGEFPSMVSIQMGAFCGGTLLNKYTVLTAAHCVKEAGRNTIVKAGAADNTKGGKYSGIRGTKMHPDYHFYGLYALHDIGLVFLKEGFDESETIGYANLAANGSDPDVTSEAIAPGWGVQDYKNLDNPSAPSDKLSKVPLRIRPRQDCWNRLLDAGETGAETIVCAGGNGRNVCKNDSGGPLVGQKGHVVGIASSVIKDEGGNYCNLEPSVFTRVGSYIAWINENLETEPPASTGEQTDVDVAFPSPTRPVPTSVPTVSDFPEGLEGVIKDFCDRRGLGSDNSCPPVVKYCVWNSKEDGYASMDACVDAFKKAGLLH
ncbi:trypsin-like protease [Metarhizium guizhouense ARSEF 977]|uniref:Trypsin-like protease n=1 Tax=Metarhizium guizhouense (strain ARSEF 977) TaxID=1276136 RepID=A0A0B4I328_METGA|nr:trypsin-like protease [Metarhizium guizhouense ARSEF 977]